MPTQYTLNCGCVVEPGCERMITQCPQHLEQWTRLHAIAQAHYASARIVAVNDDCECGERAAA